MFRHERKREPARLDTIIKVAAILLMSAVLFALGVGSLELHWEHPRMPALAIARIRRGFGDDGVLWPMRGWQYVTSAPVKSLIRSATFARIIQLLGRSYRHLFNREPGVPGSPGPSKRQPKLTALRRG